MNKNAIQKFAIWARSELIEQVKQRAYQYAITDKGYGDENATVIFGRVLSPDEKRQRQSFVENIKRNSFNQAVEEVAYTWFNSFVALRYMEVNDFLPTHVRVFSDASGGFNPEILKDVLHLDLEGLDKAKVSELLNANKTEELYRYLLLTQCNALNTLLPEMFEKMGAYTEMLLPNNILKPEGVIGRLVKDIPEEDFRDAVQIIGWLYQYYNTEPKQAVFDGLKKNIKITKENIPAATQLFTPDWIVRYMVENSLGRLWLESHPGSPLRANWKYYLDEAEQTPEVTERLRILRSENAIKSPEDIKVIDCCMGSGHILVYAFDVLMQIYTFEGYSERDAAKLILEKNIYGLEIDRRAYQLAYFALMMKARQYSRRILTEGVRPQVYEPTGYADGIEYGSLVHVDKLEPMPEQPKGQLTLFDDSYDVKLNAWNFKRLLEQKYDVVVTNPPYMGNMPVKMTEYVISEYPDSRYDMYSVFMERCTELANKIGFVAMITQHTWMFLSSFDRLRAKLLHYHWVNLTHLGTRAFEAIGGEVVQTVSFVFKKKPAENYKSKGVRLVDYDNAEAKEQAFVKGNNVSVFNSDNFKKLPGTPYVYWLSDKYYTPFDTAKTVESYVEKKAGVVTGNDPYFVRFWYEPCFTDVSLVRRERYSKYHIMQKGGGFRRYYGNNEYVIRLSDLYIPAKTNVSVRRGDADYYFKKAIGWSLVGNAQKSFRLVSDSVCGTATPTIYLKSDKYYEYILAFLNSKIAFEYLTAYNPTINLLITDICNIPLFVADEEIEKVRRLTVENIAIARADWDAFETSWDFKRHPLICGERTVAAAFGKWEREMALRFDMLKANEEELNRVFIDIYGLQDELTPEVEDKNVTLKTNTAFRYKQKKKKSNDDEFEMQEEIVEAKEIREAKFLRDTICEFISYVVGCMLGRYSLDADGLAYAGGDWDAGMYQTIPADKDNILPICDDEYFDDDILGRFVEFVKVVYGADTLEENLRFIADALGGKGTPREVIRNYFLSDFYKDHLKVYQKRPIYWLFDSGKKNGFKALIYMHRYSNDLLAKLRTDYVHEQQERYRTQLSHIGVALNTVTGTERARLLKQQDKLTEQLREITGFEEKVHHLADQNITIDLDNGVKKNYEIFADVLAKI